MQQILMNDAERIESYLETNLKFLPQILRIEIIKSQFSN